VSNASVGTEHPFGFFFEVEPGTTSTNAAQTLSIIS
jgi:hypothetical protein